MDRLDHSKCNLFSSFQAYNPGTKKGFGGHFQLCSNKGLGQSEGRIVTCSCADKRAATKCLHSLGGFLGQIELSPWQVLWPQLSDFLWGLVIAPPPYVRVQSQFRNKGYCGKRLMNIGSFMPSQAVHQLGSITFAVTGSRHVWLPSSCDITASPPPPNAGEESPP